MEARLVRGRKTWHGLREKLGFKGIGCCGSLWAGNHMTLEEYQHNYEDGEGHQQRYSLEQAASSQDAEDIIAAQGLAAAAAGEMNLAAALAAERQSAQQGLESMGTPARVSLMRLLEEGEEREKENGEEGGWWCCVCMERRKGAAFIPCGHAFCRACACELWLNRGACPLCNRAILEILHIF